MATLPPTMAARLQAIDPELRRKIEEHAYSLWEADGRPEGRALEYWLRAEQATSERAGARNPSPKRSPPVAQRSAGKSSYHQLIDDSSKVAGPPPPLRASGAPLNPGASP